MEWNNRKSEQQLLFNQRQQIQRILSHFQHVIALGQVLAARTFIHDGVDALAMNGENNRLQTALANHRDLNIQRTVNDHGALLVAPKFKTGAHRTLVILERIDKALQLRQGQLTLEGSRSVSELARVDVRRYRSFQHKRGILGMRPSTVKGIQPHNQAPDDLPAYALYKGRKMRHLLLASSSPYRRELLSRLQLPFDCASPEIDETPRPDEAPEQLVRRLAREKAQALAPRYRDHLIIGSDQVAVLDQRTLGKPHTFERARRQLHDCSGKAVTFLTGLALLDSQSSAVQVDCVAFTVHFRPLSDQQIERYLNAEQPFDCAGSFKAEGLGVSLFSATQGEDATSLIGLPLIRLVTMLNEAGIQVP